MKQTVSKMHTHWLKKHADLPPCGEEEKYRAVAADDDILSVRSLPASVRGAQSDEEFDPDFIFDGPFEGSGSKYSLGPHPYRFACIWLLMI